MKKILFIANVAKRVNNFSHSSMMAAKELGYEFHIALNWGYNSVQEIKMDEIKYGVALHQIDFKRNPLHPFNYKAYRQLLELMRNEKYDIVHCNTPVGGLIGRICAKKIGINRVIYTAHGFHFYKGANLINWFLYYPVEKYLSKLTDIIITINEEDYVLAKSFKTSKVVKVNGIGVDAHGLNEIKIDKENKRNEIGLPSEAYVLLSVGELNKNKNHQTIIKAIARINDPNFYYIICGQGVLENYLRNLTKELGLQQRVKLLGFRNDIPEICKISDIFVFPSLREGLPVALMEAMSSGLPVVCSNIRGNCDLIEEGKGGYLLKPNDIEGFAEQILKISQNKAHRIEMSKINIESAKKYDKKFVQLEMRRIYEQLMIKDLI